jgi:hypothetical protein
MDALPPTDPRHVWSPLHTVTREIHRPSHPSHCVRLKRTWGGGVRDRAHAALDRQVRPLTMQ